MHDDNIGSLPDVMVDYMVEVGGKNQKKESGKSKGKCKSKEKDFVVVQQWCLSAYQRIP